MHNTMILNCFNSDNINITMIKRQHCHIMKNITNRMLKFKPIIKKPEVICHTFFTVIFLVTSLPLLEAILLKYSI